MLCSDIVLMICGMSCFLWVAWCMDFWSVVTVFRMIFAEDGGQIYPLLCFFVFFFFLLSSVV